MRAKILTVIAISIAAAVLAWAGYQEGPAKPPEPVQAVPVEYFSGNVDELTAEKIVVVRTALNKTPEKRSFSLNGETKIEGKLKVKSRVTVRYTNGEQGLVALAILVRVDKKK